MHRLTLVSTVAIFMLFSSACSDDGDNPPSDAGSDAAQSGGGPHDKDASTKLDASGEGDANAQLGAEGAVCQTTRDCGSKLRCIQASNDQVSIGICARPCESREQCEDGEICYAYTQDPADAHCVNLISKTYAFCGVGETSRCDRHTCLYFPSSTVGLCVDLCSLEDTSADAGSEDAGAPVVSDAGVLLAICHGGQTCVSGVVDSTTQGLCGVEVERGDKCSVPTGRFCKPGNGCVPDDPKDANDTRHCRQDCSTDGKCASGTACKGIVGQSAYCY